MGKYEDQLKALGTADAVWRIEGITRLESQMAQLKSDMEKLAADPGWTGSSAEAAKAMFETLKESFGKNEEKLNKVRSALGDANGFRGTAAGATSDLPDATVPDWIHTAAVVGGGIMIPVPGIGNFAAEFVVERVNEYMGLQREAAALKKLEELEKNLEAPKNTIKANALNPKANFPEWPEEAPTPEWPGPPVVYNGDDTGSGAWSTNGTPTYTPSGGGGGSETGGTLIGFPKPPKPEVVICYPPNPPIVLPPVRPDGWPGDFVKPPEISIDGDSGNGSNPGGLLGGGSGGLGLGLAGAGAAGIGAAKLASKGGLGGGGLFGPNGLLGGGAGGAGGANGSGGGAGSKSGVAGAGAGSKGGNSAMMGGGQGGGSSDKEKRTSLGLMAPKLEDDDESGPRSSAAGAGGRD